jgi:hypothetical protein
MSEPILRPCPYCGGRAYVAKSMGSKHIVCDHKRKCRMKPDTWLISAMPLTWQIKAWNMRVE